MIIYPLLLEPNVTLEEVIPCHPGESPNLLQQHQCHLEPSSFSGIVECSGWIVDKGPATDTRQDHPVDQVLAVSLTKSVLESPGFLP
jgi:hypothetical protein